MICVESLHITGEPIILAIESCVWYIMLSHFPCMSARYILTSPIAHPYRQLAASAYALVDVRDVKLDEGEQVFFRDVRCALVVELYQRVLEAREELAERFRASVYLSPERAVGASRCPFPL